MMQLYRLVIDGALVSDESDEYIYIIHISYPSYAYLPDQNMPSIPAKSPALQTVISPVQFKIENGDFSEFFVYLNIIPNSLIPRPRFKLDLLKNPDSYSITKHEMKFYNNPDFVEKYGRPRYDVNPIPVNYDVSLAEILPELEHGDFLGNYISIRWELVSHRN